MYKHIVLTQIGKKYKFCSENFLSRNQILLFLEETPVLPSDLDKQIIQTCFGYNHVRIAKYVIKTN